ncbi:hypothetical protein [Thauera humireducens]|nr:hypothetical protein [Thauera humireducens]
MKYYVVLAKAVTTEVPGTLRYEPHRYVHNPANLTLTTFIDDDTFDRMITEIENWRLNPPDYSALAVNCVGFVDRLARIAGLDTPPWKQVFPDAYLRELLLRNQSKLVCNPPLLPDARKDEVIDRWVTSRRPLMRTDAPARLQEEILRGQRGAIGRIIKDIYQAAADLERSFVGSSVIRRAMENEHNARVSAVSVAEQERASRYQQSLRKQMESVAPLPGASWRSLETPSSKRPHKFPCIGVCLEFDASESDASPRLQFEGETSTGADLRRKVVMPPVDSSDNQPRLELHLTRVGNRLEGSVGIVDLGPRVVGEAARVTFLMQSRYAASMAVAIFVEGMTLDEESIRTRRERMGIDTRQLPRHVFVLPPAGLQEIAVEIPPIRVSTEGTEKSVLPPTLTVVANGETVASLSFVYSAHSADRVDVRYRSSEGWRSGHGWRSNEPPYSICSGESPPNYALVGSGFSLKSLHMKHSRSCNENTNGVGEYAVCHTVRTGKETCYQFQVQGHHKGGLAPESISLPFEVDVLWQYALVRSPPAFVVLRRE